MQLDSHWTDIGGRLPESLIGAIREKLNCIGISVVSGEGRDVGMVAVQWWAMMVGMECGSQCMCS